MAETGSGSWISLFYFASVVGQPHPARSASPVLLALIGGLSTVSMIAAGIDAGSALSRASPCR